MEILQYVNVFTAYLRDSLNLVPGQTVYRFLLKLKSLLREYNSRAAAMVTLPAHLMRNMHNGPAQLRRLEWLCDTVIELESFAGKSTNETYEFSV